MHSRYNIVLVFFTALVFFACGASLYLPVQTDADRSGIPVDSLKTGRKLYVNSCAGCHNLRLPERFTKEEWDTIIPRMQIKAKINDRRAALIKEYLLSRSKSN